MFDTCVTRLPNIMKGKILKDMLSSNISCTDDVDCFHQEMALPNTKMSDKKSLASQMKSLQSLKDSRSLIL